MVNRGKQKAGLAAGAWGHDSRCGARPGSGPQRPRFMHRGGYMMAGLALLALWGVWSLGAIGCTASGPGYGRIDSASGLVLANMRQSPEEIARLERNAHYYKLMGQPALGLKEMELALQQDPDNLQIANLLARNYEELGMFEAARQLYQEALTRHGPHAVLANNLCFSYYQEGRWQKAEACFRQTLDRDPGNVAARNNLGLLYCRLGRQDEARRLWQETEGAEAADGMIGRALAALGMPAPTFARAAEPAPPAARATQAATPKTAASRLPTPGPVKPAAPAQPAAPKKAAVHLAVKAPAPASAEASPRPETLKPAPSPQKALAAEISGPFPQAAPQFRQAPLTAAELADTAIEVRNGTWTKNLARQTRTRLRQEGFTVARIGNHVDFGAAKTIIYYRPEAERVARTVGATFFPQAELSPNPNLKKRMDIKILLGADLRQQPQQVARLADGVQ